MTSQPGEKRRRRRVRLWMFVPLLLALLFLAVPTDWWVEWGYRLTSHGRWETRYDKGFSLIGANRYAEAEAQLEKALEIAENSFGSADFRTANNLYNLGVAYYEQDKMNEAENMFQRHVRLTAEVFGPTDKYVAMGLDFLAETYFSQNKIEESISASKRALSIYEETLPADDASLAWPLHCLGVDYVVLNPPTHYDEAERHLLQALTIREQHLPPDDPKLQETRDWLWRLYMEQGRYAAAQAVENAAAQDKAGD